MQELAKASWPDFSGIPCSLSYCSRRCNFGLFIFVSDFPYPIGLNTLLNSLEGLIPLVHMSAQTSTELKWYAVQCLSNHEDKVRRYLCKYKEENGSLPVRNEILVPIELFRRLRTAKSVKGIENFIPVMFLSK